MAATRIPFLDLKAINRSFEPELTIAARRVIDSGSYIRSEEVRRFEDDFASFIGTRHCVGVGNGYDALRLIFKAWLVMGALQEGDEVLVPANTYIASILPVVENRLRPVFVEPESGTMNIDAEALEACVTPRTRALMVVHLYGRNAITPELLAFAKERNLRVIEDNAQAAGCMGPGGRTGSLGDAAAHSFYPTKNLGALGDGGAVTTDDDDLAGMVRTLANYGSAHPGHNDVPGVNSRLDEIQAAMLRVKLGRLDEDNEKRRHTARYYFSNMTNDRIALPVMPQHPSGHVWHLFVIRSPQRDRLRHYLNERGIETMIHYPVPPHRQGAFGGTPAQPLPVTEKIHDEVLSLPLHPLLRDDEVTRIAESVSAFRG